MSEEPITTTIQQTPQLLLMRAKYPALKQKLSQPFPYFYQAIPKDQQMYNTKQIQLANKLKQNPQMIDLGSCIIIIMSKIQGMCAENDLKIQLPKIFSYENKQFWDALIKQKTSMKWLGQPKQKSYSIYQIKDIQQLKQLYDVQQIKKQRKLIKQYSTMYKSICKFVQKYDKLKTTQQITQLYQQYKKTQQQQSKMMKLLNGDKNKVNSNKIIKAQTPIKEINKDEVKIIQNNSEIVQDMKNQNNDINNNKMDIQEQQRKVQNNQIQCNKVCNTNNNEQKQKPMESQQPKQTKQNEQKKSKKKTQPKQQTSSKKQPKVVVDKQQQMMSKYKSLDLFFKKKKPQNQQQQQNTQKPKQQQKQSEMQNQIAPQQKIDKTDIFLDYITSTAQKPSIQSLKSQFIATKKIIIKQFTTCYINIVMKRSRLQYYDFQIKQLKADFINPQIQKQNIRYDDSSDQYSQLVADSINQQMIQQQQQQEQQQQSNSAIVSDSYCQYKSSHIFSSEDESDQQQQNKIKPQIVKNIGKWYFNNKQIQKRQKYSKYDIINLIQDTFPIIVKQQIQQTNNQVTCIQKIDMYKQIHGSYTPKDILIKKLNTIVDNKITMNKLSTMIKDICQKKGNQRVIKSQIIKQISQQMTEVSPNLQMELEQLRAQRQNVRNQQAEAKREQKMNQKDQRLQKLIQQYEGIMTTNAILEYLRNKQMKLIKQDLNALIKVKQGEKWEHIRNQIKKSKLIRGKKQKAPKVPKINKNEQLEEEIKNTHRPIEQIMRQNQIDMANRPKKIKIRKQMVQQGDRVVQVEIQEEVQEQVQLDVNDQSYQVKQKPSKKKKSNKGKKGKKMIFKMDTVLPVRRNPKRNKRKVNKQNQKEQQNEPQKMQNEDNNKSEESAGQKQQCQKNQQGSNSNNKQSNEQSNENQSKEMEVPSDKMVQEKQQQKQMQQENILKNNQVNQAQSSSKQQQQKQQSSPIKNAEKTPKNEKSSIQKDQKTANKISTAQQIRISTETPM